jgi:hypothetical protein
MILSEYMQLILGRAGEVWTKGKEGVGLEKSISEVKDEDIGLGCVVLEPIF